LVDFGVFVGLGDMEGTQEGALLIDGRTEGRELADGRTEGSSDGKTLGSSDGKTLGSSDGKTLGSPDGKTLGSFDGVLDGDGDTLGAHESYSIIPFHTRGEKLNTNGNTFPYPSRISISLFSAATLPTAMPVVYAM
jgi:hypothetical protein